MRVWQREWKKSDGSVGRSSEYSYRFKFDNVLQTGTTGKTNYRDALNFAKEFLGNLTVAKAQAAVSGGNHPTKAKNMTIGQACAQYYDNVVSKEDDPYASGKAKANALHDFDNLQWITAQLGENKLVTDIIGQDVQKLVNARMAEGSRKNPGKPIAGATVNRSTSELLKRVLRWAEEFADIQGMKKIKWGHSSVKQRETGPRKRILLPDELIKLRTAMKLKETESYRAAFEFDMISGLRRENFTHLKWSEIFWSENLIRVTQKGGGKHEAHISDKMKEIIEAQKDANGKPYHPVYVFTFIAQRNSSVKEHGGPFERGKHYGLTYDGFGSWWSRLCIKAKVTNVRIHDIRRTSGSNINEIAGLAAASSHLGHSDVTTTAKHYVVVSPEKMLDTMNKAAALEALNKAVSPGETTSET